MLTRSPRIALLLDHLPKVLVETLALGKQLVELGLTENASQVVRDDAAVIRSSAAGSGSRAPHAIASRPSIADATEHRQSARHIPPSLHFGVDAGQSRSSRHATHFSWSLQIGVAAGQSLFDRHGVHFRRPLQKGAAAPQSALLEHSAHSPFAKH
jgi:hypothetical protein